MTAMGSAKVRETTRLLQEAITSGRWPINSQIPPESDLARELGVGRSTVREAVRGLAHLGMLEPAPGRGTFVRSLNPVRGLLTSFVAEHAWDDILTVRRGLEVQAASLAAEHCGPEGLARLRTAHEHGTDGVATDDCGRTPGQFHAVLMEVAGNRLLAELYSGLLGAIRQGLTSGALRHGLDETRRHAEHGTLLAAITAGNPVAAGALAAQHAAQDLVAVGEE